MTAPFMLPQPLAMPPRTAINTTDPTQQLSAGVGSFIEGLQQQQKLKRDEAFRQAAMQVQQQQAETNEGYRRAQEARLAGQTQLGQETVDAKAQNATLTAALQKERDQHLLDQLKVARPDLAESYSKLEPGVDSKTLEALRPALFGVQGTPVVGADGKVMFMPSHQTQGPTAAPPGAPPASATPPSGSAPPAHVTALPTNVTKAVPGTVGATGAIAIPNVLRAIAEANDMERRDPTSNLNTAFGGFGQGVASATGKLFGEGAQENATTAMQSPAQIQAAGPRSLLVHNLVGLMPHSRSQAGLLKWINEAYFPPPGTSPSDHTTIAHFRDERNRLGVLLSQLPHTATEADVARALGVPADAFPEEPPTGGAQRPDPFAAYAGGH